MVTASVRSVIKAKIALPRAHSNYSCTKSSFLFICGFLSQVRPHNNANLLCSNEIKSHRQHTQWPSGRTQIGRANIFCVRPSAFTCVSRCTNISKSPGRFEGFCVRWLPTSLPPFAHRRAIVFTCGYNFGLWTSALNEAT